MIIEISVAVIALAFTILVIYLIVMINILRHTFEQVDETLTIARKQFSGVGEEAKKVMENANSLSDEVKLKFDSLTSLFNTVSSVGTILEDQLTAFRDQITTSAKKDEKPFHSRFKSGDNVDFPELEKIASILELAGLGVRLWQKLKHRR